MKIWLSRSDPVRQLWISGGCALAGVVLAVASELVPPSKGATAALALGCLLLVAGLLGALVAGRQSILVDPVARVISVKDSTRFSQRIRVIAFKDIERISTERLRKRATRTSHYFLVLHLPSNEQYTLFAPGRAYVGSSDKLVVESWRARLTQFMNAPV